MGKVLTERRRNDGVTEIDVDLDGERVVTVSVLTATRSTVTDTELEAIARIQRERATIPPAQP